MPRTSKYTLAQRVQRLRDHARSWAAKNRPPQSIKRSRVAKKAAKANRPSSTRYSSTCVVCATAFTSAYPQFTCSLPCRFRREANIRATKRVTNRLANPAAHRKRSWRVRVRDAQSKGLASDLTFEEIVWPVRCPVFGVEIDYIAPRAATNSPSLDRLTPNLGYTKCNTAVISSRANLVKNDGTASEHRRIAEWMDEQQEQLRPTTLFERVALAQAESDMLYTAAAQ